MAEVIEINDVRELASVRLAWNALLPDTPGASLFHTADWVELYWKHFGAGQRLRVLVVLSCGQPIGIVPLCVRLERFRVGPVRVLTYPLHDWGTWYGPIGPNVAATMLMAMRHLRERPRDWDLLELRWTDDNQSDRARTFRAMRAVGFRPHRAAYQETSVVQLDGRFSDYWESRASKWRNNLRRAERRLEKFGDVQYVRHRPESLTHGDGEPRWDLYNACCTIAGKSWQGQLADNTTLSSKRVGRFLREAHAVAARLGMLDMNLLAVDGQPAAFAYNYHFDSRVQGLRAGYNRALADAGTGSVVLARAIEDSFARGDAVYDLGTGWREYKQRLQTNVQTSYRLTHYRFTGLKSQGVRLSRWLKRSAALRAVRHKQGVKNEVAK